METPNTYNTLGTVKEQLRAVRFSRKPVAYRVGTVDENRNDRRDYYSLSVGCGQFGISRNVILHRN